MIYEKTRKYTHTHIHTLSIIQIKTLHTLKASIFKKLNLIENKTWSRTCKHLENSLKRQTLFNHAQLFHNTYFSQTFKGLHENGFQMDFCIKIYLLIPFSVNYLKYSYIPWFLSNTILFHKMYL